MTAFLQKWPWFLELPQGFQTLMFDTAMAPSSHGRASPARDGMA
ncbi:MAG TPA: hypothetical protein PLL33_00270 [Paracoccus sp. (in: a-proteobacteria)]|nr:hypothetical protein [Paracoccus sp. (in: a-proteobacteria)]